MSSTLSFGLRLLGTSSKDVCEIGLTLITPSSSSTLANNHSLPRIAVGFEDEVEGRAEEEEGGGGVGDPSKSITEIARF